MCHLYRSGAEGGRDRRLAAPARRQARPRATRRPEARPSGQEIRIHRGTGARIVVTGDATFGSNDPARVRRGAVNVGEVAATVAVEAGTVAFAIGEDGATRAFDTKGPEGADLCRVRLWRLGGYLIAADNMMCGGMCHVHRRLSPRRSVTVDTYPPPKQMRYHGAAHMRPTRMGGAPVQREEINMFEKSSDRTMPLIQRRLLLMMTGAASIGSLLLPQVGTHAAEGAMFVYVGSYTKDPPGGGNNNPVGLSVFRFDPATGALTPVQQVKSANPSFVALDPSHRFLYVINEIDDYQGQKTGSAEAYSIDPNTGMLTLLNRQSVGGPIPAHLTTDPDGKFLVVANYIGGNFVVLPIAADGRLDPVSNQVVEHGSGPNKQRQEAPHPHIVTYDPAGKHIAAADLGIDKVMTFRLDNGRLERVSEASVAPGAGPRHIAFRLDGKVMYVTNELNATVTAFAYDPATGTIGKELQTISTEPAGYDGPHSTAEIAVHPSGKFLYVSNRGYNSIIGYRIDPATGMLSVIGHAKEGVSYPRNFAIDPGGKWLYVANQKGDTIVQFEVDQESGALKPTGQVAASITPVVMVFRPAG